MHILTLTTDWQNSDYYEAVLKAYLLSELPELKILDIAHQIEKFNKHQAAFILKNSFHYFPKNTIHIVSVWSDVSEEKAPIIARLGSQYFICADNGILHYALNETNAEFFRLRKSMNTNFPALELFAPIAVHLINQLQLEKIAEPTKKISRLVPYLPLFEENEIKRQVIYIDSFGNVITNITQELFNDIGKGRNFTIFPGTNYYLIKNISKTYAEIEGGELLALFNSHMYLEIAINQGNVSELIKIGLNSIIKIQFHDH